MDFFLMRNFDFICKFVIQYYVLYKVMFMKRLIAYLACATLVAAGGYAFQKKVAQFGNVTGVDNSTPK